MRLIPLLSVSVAVSLAAPAYAQEFIDFLSREELQVARGLLEEALAEARTAIYALRPSPLDELGLVAGLEALAGRSFGPEVEVVVAADIHGAMPAHLESTLYRIGQELLSNVRKHAGAQRVELGIESDPVEIRLRVVDDGEGFDVAGYRRARPESSFGLVGIAERIQAVGGSLTIRSRVGQGTRVEVRLPLEPARRASREAREPSSTPAQKRSRR